MIKRVIAILLSPLCFSVGFLLPLFAQVLLLTGWPTQAAWGTAALVALALGAMAQLRGSWLWLKP